MKMVPLQIFLVTIIIIIPIATISASEETSCEERCTRLKQRSLMRVGYDDERLQTLFDRQRPLESMKDVCWRLFDNIDCMKKCPKSEKHAVFAKLVRNKCKFVLQDMEHHLKCVSKHQSFLKTRCSSFLNEASRLRAQSDLSTTPHHEECRFLHLNTICLENHVNTFCPDARVIFRRLNFRDYFLSFVLPKDDDLFDDEDLDSCQIYDFVKDAEKKAKEEAEQRKEEERRRRIEDDEDYEEELTTIVNDLEEDDDPTNTSPTSTTPISLSDTTEKLEETTMFFPMDEIEEGSTTISSDQEEFSSIIKDLTESGENINTTSPTIELTTVPDLDLFPPDQIYDDPEEEYLDDNATHPTISVVAIEARSSSTASDEDSKTRLENDERTGIKVIGEEAEDTTTLPIHLTPPNKNLEDVDQVETSTVSLGVTMVETTEKPTTRRKVFSEDSMEQTPPNFEYSSNRGYRYDTTTRSNYVADNMNKMESDETPLEIDTSTLFGIEDETVDPLKNPNETHTHAVAANDKNENEGIEKKDNDEEIRFVLKSSTVATQTDETSDGASPWLTGGVVVKPILNFDQADVDEAEARERQHRLQLQKNAKDRRVSDDFRPNATNNFEDENDMLSDYDSAEKLIALGLISVVTCLIVFIILLLVIHYCAEKSATYNVQKNSAA